MFKIIIEDGFFTMVDSENVEFIRHPLRDINYNIIPNNNDATNPWFRFNAIAGKLIVLNNNNNEFPRNQLQNSLGVTYTTVEAVKTDLAIIGNFNIPQESGKTNSIEVTQANHEEVFSTIDDTVEYFIVEPITLNQSIDIQNKDITIRSYGTAIPRLIAGGAFPIFTSTSEEAQSIFLYNIAIQNDFIGSTVFNLISENGFSTLQLIDVNFISSDSLGELKDFRQVFYSTVAYLGGKPSLTFSGNFGGFAAIGFNAINISDTMTEPLFKAGDSLIFSSTFDLRSKIDLGSTAPLFDFSDVNFEENESLILDNNTVNRNGVFDDTDLTIFPNISESNIKCLWKNNTGLPNTQKKIRSTINTELETVITAQNDYVDLAGVFLPEFESHFDMPSNGEFRLLTGSGVVTINAFFQIKGTQGDIIDIRVLRSNDNGLTYTDEVYHRGNKINSLVGLDGIGFFYVDGDAYMKKFDRLKFQVENKTRIASVTAQINGSTISLKI